MSPRTPLASLVAVAALALGGAALAHDAGAGPGAGACAMGAGPSAMRGPGMGAQPEAVTQRLTQVKDALKLSPDQQNAWSTYEQAVKRAADGRARLHESMQATRGQGGAMSDATRDASRDASRDAMSDAHVAMLKFNAQSAEEINDARKALVAVLSPEQKTTFETARRGARAHGGHGGHGGYGPGAQRQPS